MESKKNKKYSRVYVEITNVCNMSCSFCPGTKREPRFMSKEELSVLLDKLVGITDHLYFHLMGEPTLHPNLVEFIEMATLRGYRPMLTTNGSLLSDFGAQIVAAGAYKVNISLHSFEKNSRAEQKAYLEGCVNFAKLAASRGVIVALRLWNGGSGADNSSVLEFLHESFPDGWISGNRGDKLADKIFLEYADRFAWPDILGEDLGEEIYCHGLSDHFGILCDGSIVPCCLDRDGVITLGNAFSDDIRQVLSGERCMSMLEGFRNRRVIEPLCKRCPYARRF